MELFFGCLACVQCFFTAFPLYNRQQHEKQSRQKNDGQLESSIKVQSAAVFQREALAGVLAQETPGEPLALFTTELFTNLQEKHSSSTVLTVAASAAQFTDLQMSTPLPDIGCSAAT